MRGEDHDATVAPVVTHELLDERNAVLVQPDQRLVHEPHGPRHTRQESRERHAAALAERQRRRGRVLQVSNAQAHERLAHDR